MNRTYVRLLLVASIAALAAYLNADLFVPGYRHPQAVRNLLSWQGEPEQRALTLRQGLDLQGGLQVLLQARPERGRSAVSPEDLATAATIIQNRIDALGVTEPIVQTQGADKIVVELPGVDDPDLAIRTIGQTARLEFVFAADGVAEGTIVETTYPNLYDEIQAAVDGGTLDPARLRPFLGDRDEPLPELAGADTAGGEGDTSGADSATAAVTDTLATEPPAEPAATDAPAPTAAIDAASALTDTGTITGTEAIEATDGITATDGVTATDAVTATDGITATNSVTATDGITATDGVTATDGITATAATTDTAEAAADDDGPSDIDESLATIYPTVIDGSYVQDAFAGRDPTTNQVAVSFQLNGQGGIRMRKFSSDHVGEVMAIVLDGRVVSAPVLRDAIGSDGQITGDFTPDEADALAIQIKSGALPVSLEVVGQTKIGPTLGAGAVGAAINGGIVGLLAVMLFMLLYYRMPGIVADIALLLYALLTLAIFRILPVTLTLAGIAGFVLSIGMAVDANILIFERMKEELREGRRVRTAIETGFKRAWPSIRDSNFSTLISCAILFWFGNQFGASIVKGFAVTLALGVLTSMFTAIFATRALLSVFNRLLVRGDARGGDVEGRLKALFGQ